MKKSRRTSKPRPGARNTKCDRKTVEEFDYSALSSAFSALSKPAQRALINNGIFDEGDLATWSEKSVLELHGIGPSAIPILRNALKKRGLSFND